ncbi:MAG: DUF4129 domain-containing protein [Coriobacteriia bacterium]|nr:DUF4129 domain-containing protein [Coriobacteriia bacterium]
MTQRRGRRFAGLALAAALTAGSALPTAVAAPAEGGTAATSEEYARRVETARRGVADVKPVPDAEEAAKLAERLTALLPDGERVSVGESEVEVDVSVLSGLAVSLAGASTPSARERELARVEAHLDSLALAVDGAPSARNVRSDPGALQRLLAERGGRRTSTLVRRVGELVERALRWLQERLDALLTPQRGSRVGITLTTVVTVVLVGVLAFVAVRAALAARTAIARRGRAVAAQAEEAGTPVVAAAEGLPADALSYAEELAAAGEYRAAVRALFGGAARRLVETGVVAQTRTRTDAELLADVGPAAAAALGPLAELTGRFERAWYGHADPGAAGFADARERYREVLRAVAA